MSDVEIIRRILERQEMRDIDERLKKDPNDRRAGSYLGGSILFAVIASIVIGVLAALALDPNYAMPMYWQ